MCTTRLYGKLEDKHAEWLCNHTLVGIPPSRQRLHLFGADVLVLDDFSYDIASPNSTRTLAALGSYDERTTKTNSTRTASAQ